MWDKFKRYFGYVWSFPVTFFGLAYASAFQLARWYKWHGIKGDALVWCVDGDRSPQWLLKLWQGWAGHTIGNVVVLKKTPEQSPVILVHEQKHVDQCMRLGVFQPILYGLNLAAIKIGCAGSDPYYSNPFEIDARRAAGQLIDVEGAIKKIAEKKSI